MLGSLAKCSQGWPGIVTGYKEVTYSDGNKAMAWVGVHISKSRLGEPWSSRRPEVFAEPDKWGVYTFDQVAGMNFPIKKVE